MKASRIFASAVVAAATLIAPVTVHAGFYPADRQTYTCITPDNCPGADHITFNSFTNNPVAGDERPFLAGSINGANVQDRMKVKDGDVIVVRAYVHNNADATKMGSVAKTVAKNVNIKVLVPTASQNDTNMVGFISADNASPKSINDTMSVYGDRNFTLEYVKGSAEFTHKPDGVNQVTTKLSDNIVTPSGASLGDITGCFAYSGWVTLEVKVNMPTPVTPVYSCDLLTLTKGENRKVTASVAYTAKNGASFKTATFDWGNGTTPFTTSNTTASYQYSKDGTYTIVAKLLMSVNGTDTVVNGEGCAKQVTFGSTTPPVTPPTELPNTGAGSVVGVIAGVSAVSALAYRLVLSRKLARR